MEEKPAVTLPRAHPLICVHVPRFNTIPSCEWIYRWFSVHYIISINFHFEITCMFVFIF